MGKLESLKRKSLSIFKKMQGSYSAADRIIKKIRKVAVLSAYWGAVSVVGIVIAVVILQANHVPVIQPANAGGEWMGILLGSFLYYAVIGPIGVGAVLVGWIMQLVINYPFGSVWNGGALTTGSTSTGGFVNVSAVVTGWKLVRDVCNMFFSLILVIIALATVLKIEAYSWKQMLPKLVLMAVLINFSKTICGIFTDMATVAMATFGGSFSGSFFSGIVGAFGLPSLTTVVGGVDDTATYDSGITTVILAYIAAAIMTMVFFVVMLSFTVTLLFRIVMLWFLIVLSPLAYITRILPQTKKYSSQWWEMFGRYVVVGPLVTFFLWLSLTMAFGTSVGSSSGGGNGLSVGFSSSSSSSISTSTGYSPPSGTFASANPNVLANFLIATMMLMASLKLIHQMAAEAGKLTGAVEGAAWGAGAALMTMPGRLMQSFSGGVGKLTRVNDQGETVAANALDRTLYNLSHGRTGKAAAFLGSTVFQPTDWFQGVVKGREESHKEKKEIAKNKAEQSLHGMRGDAVAGGAYNGIFGRLSRIAGVIGGAGLDPKQVTDEYVSGGGLLRMGGKFMRRNFAGRADELEAEQRQLEEQERQLNNRYTEEQATGAAADHEARTAAEGAVTTQAAQIAAGDPVQVLNQEYAEVEAALQAHIAGLQERIESAQRSNDQPGAARLQTSLNDLQNTMRTGGQITLEDMEQLYDGDPSAAGTAQIRTALSQAYTNRAGSLHQENEALGTRLRESGWNDQYGGAAAFNNLTTPEEREAMAAQVRDRRLRVSKLRSETQIYQEGDSYEARKHTQHLISEEAHKIGDIDNTQELGKYFERAVREKNQYMAEAILREITKKGDLNEFTQQYLADQGVQPAPLLDHHGHPVNDANGQPVMLQPQSDGEGLELFRQRILMEKLGMTGHESTRLANDTSYIAEGIGQMGYSRSYAMDPQGHLTFQPSHIRARAAGAEIRKTDVSKWLGWNRLAWGKEVGADRHFELSDLGRQLLVANGNSLGQQRLWERFNANSKLNLSHPNVVAQLRTAGVDNEFITKLEDYWTNTGQYETPDATRRRQRGAVSRFANYQQPAAH